MNVAEKLRFLADRVEDEKEFYISTFTNPYFFNTEGLMRTKDHQTEFRVNTILEYSVSLKKPIVFTEDEKVILKNLPPDFKWITRDASNWLYVYTNKPAKTSELWEADMGDMENVTVYDHLFDSVQWSDDEPCEFRKYL